MKKLNITLLFSLNIYSKEGTGITDKLNCVFLLTDKFIFNFERFSVQKNS